MVQIASIQHAQSTAMVGRDIVLWGAGRSLELAFRGTETALSIANRGLGRALQRGKKLAADTREATGLKQELPELVRQRAREDYTERVAATLGILETSPNPEVIKAVKEDHGRIALTYSEFCIQNGVSVDPDTALKITSQIIDGGLGLEAYERVTNELKVEVPVGAIIDITDNGLERHVGSFDPSVPFEPAEQATSLPRQSQ